MKSSFNPNTVQFGGDHYIRAGHNQHWDMLPSLGYGWEYYLARASAYLTRVKDPELDPQKAGHFLDKLMWLIEQDLVPATFRPTGTPNVDLDSYMRETYLPANGIMPASLEGRAIVAIMSARTLGDLRKARDLCSLLEAGTSSRDMFVPAPQAKAEAKAEDPLSPGWPFVAGAAAGYVDQDADAERPTPKAFSSGGGGDYAGAGATSAWEEPKKDERTFVLADSAIAATSYAEREERPNDPHDDLTPGADSTDRSGSMAEESCRASDYSSSDSGSSSSDSSSSSSDSSSSSGGGGGGTD